MSAPPPEWFTAGEAPSVSGLRKFRWWHRLKGHHTRNRFDLIAPPYAWECYECDLIMGHF